MNVRKGFTRFFIVLWLAWAAVLAYTLLGSAGSQPTASPPVADDDPIFDEFPLADSSAGWFERNAPVRPAQVVRESDGTAYRFPADASRDEIREVLTAEALGKRVKEKYPGVYDDLADVELGRKVKGKYPEAYRWFERREAIRDSMALRREAIRDSIALAAAREERTRSWALWAGFGIVAPALLLAGTLWVWAGFAPTDRKSQA